MVLALGLRGRVGSVLVLTLLIVIGVGLLAGCDSGTPAPAATATVAVATPTATDEEGMGGLVTATPIPSPVGLDTADLSGVYAAVIMEMLEKEGKEVRHVYISPYIGQGEHLDNPDADTPIPAKLLSTLKSADKSKSRLYEARSFEEVVSFDDASKVKNGGVLITLGPIVNEAGKADSVSVRASIYREAASAEGNIYSLERDASVATGWKLLTAAPEWDSGQ